MILHYLFKHKHVFAHVSLSFSSARQGRVAPGGLIHTGGVSFALRAAAGTGNQAAGVHHGYIAELTPRNQVSCGPQLCICVSWCFAPCEFWASYLPLRSCSLVFAAVDCWHMNWYPSAHHQQSEKTSVEKAGKLSRFPSLALTWWFLNLSGNELYVGISFITNR